MVWNQQELEALYMNVYARRITCPRCGGGLRFLPSNALDAAGDIRCPACAQEHFVAMRNDPLRDRFRPYTAEESRQIFAAERARRAPVCPVDGTEMDVHLQRSLGRTSNATIRCRRCG